jgi:hypothetical protein
VALTVPLAAWTTLRTAPSESVERTVAASDDTAGCTHVDEPMLDIPTSDTEPRMRIPQPAGWEPLADLGDVKVTRFAMVKSDRTDPERPRQVVTVSLQRFPITDAPSIFDRSHSELVQLFQARGWPTDLTTTDDTVCGLPAQTITYAGDSALGADPATVLLVAINACGHSYLVMLTQSPGPDVPASQNDAALFLSGLQVLPPATSR